MINSNTFHLNVQMKSEQAYCVTTRVATRRTCPKYHYCSRKIMFVIIRHTISVYILQFDQSC